MNSNPKIFQTVAYKQEQGLPTGLTPQSKGWGDPASWQVPGANDAFPYLELGNQIETVKVQDNSITTGADKSANRRVGEKIDKPFNFHPRFYGIDFWLYWMFGYVNNANTVVVFTAGASPWSTTEPDVGTVFLDTTVPTPLEFTYHRTFKGKDHRGDVVNYYVFSHPTDVPLLAAGDLTEEAPGTRTFTYTAHSTLKYERLYELDKNGQFHREFTAFEKANLDEYAPNDGAIKNTMVTLCKKFTSHDVRFANSICRSWELDCPSADLMQFKTNFLAWKEDRSASPHGWGSDTWTVPAHLVPNNNIPAAYQAIIELGTELSNLQTVCPSDFNISCTIPFQQIQTLCSGMSIADPVLEGYYDIMFRATIARYNEMTFQNWRDADQLLFARVGMNSGFDSMEFMLKNIVLDEAGAGEGDVAEEVISGSLSKCAPADDIFAGDWLHGLTQHQDRALILRTINNMPVNPMFLV